MSIARDIIKSIKPRVLKKAVPRDTPLGELGYDNVRDDIEKVKKMREGSITKVPATPYDIVNKSYCDGNITSPAGSNTQIQYNDNGAFGANANFVFKVSDMGIGTTNPAGRLEVRGGNGLVVSDSEINMTNNSVGQSSKWLYIQDGNTDYFGFHKAVSGYAIIKNNEGEIRIQPHNDTDDYIRFRTISNIPEINAVGANLKITAAGGTVDFDNEHITTTGNITGATITGSTITDGTLSINSGSIASAVNITASTTITGGTLTDGTCTITGGTIDATQLLTTTAGMDLIDFTGIPAAPGTTNFIFNTDPVGPITPGVTVGYMCAWDPALGIALFFPYEV